MKFAIPTIAIFLSVFPTTLFAIDKEKLALPISATFGMGTLQNSEMHLKSRTMNSIDFEALPGYRFESLTLIITESLAGIRSRRLRIQILPTSSWARPHGRQLQQVQQEDSMELLQVRLIL
jgi:hypothetical protein